MLELRGRALWSFPLEQELTHTYGYAYGLDSGATRRPRVPIPKNTSKNHWGLENLQEEVGPKSQGRRRRSGRYDDVRSHLQVH